MIEKTRAKMWVDRAPGGAAVPARPGHTGHFGIRVRFHIIRNARIENVGKSQSCMVSKVRIIWKQTVHQMLFKLLYLVTASSRENAARAHVGRVSRLHLHQAVFDTEDNRHVYHRIHA